MRETINNRYRILQALGSGGCGQTFLVEDTHLPSKPYRVIKKLKSASDVPKYYQVIKERFDREAAVLEELGRSNDRIPTLYAYFNEGDEFYLVQDFINGKNLKEAVQEHGVFNETQVRYLLKTVLHVLDFVHSRGIIHRDIKPENIMLRDSDGVPVLIDFGAVKEVVATVVDSHGIPTSTIIIGTPGFMPLEQSAGRPIFASDLYSLGLTAIFLLTGKYPLDMLDKQTGEIVWRKYAPNVSEHLARILTKVIEPNPRDRFLNARDMLLGLQADEVEELTVVRQRQNRPNPSNEPPFVRQPESGKQPSPPPPQFVPRPPTPAAPAWQAPVLPQRFAIEPGARVQVFFLYVVLRVVLTVFFNLVSYALFSGFQLTYRYRLSNSVITVIGIFVNLLDDVALGAMQFWLLRKHLRLTPVWIIVTLGCGLLASLLQLPFYAYVSERFSSGSISPGEYLIYLAMSALFYLFVIAAGQAILLAKRVKFAGLWILAIFPAQILYSMIYSATYASLYGIRGGGPLSSQILFNILHGLFIGVAQAVCLLLFQKKDFLLQDSTYHSSFNSSSGFK
jgi:serine/threonine protein kinase